MSCLVSGFVANSVQKIVDFVVKPFFMLPFDPFAKLLNILSLKIDFRRIFPTLYLNRMFDSNVDVDNDRVKVDSPCNVLIHPTETRVSENCTSKEMFLTNVLSRQQATKRILFRAKSTFLSYLSVFYRYAHPEDI